MSLKNSTLSNESTIFWGEINPAFLNLKINYFQAHLVFNNK